MECGSCTLCCTLLPVAYFNKPAGVTCKHCSVKCEIHKIRPAVCREYECAYYQMDKVSKKLRPDNCGIIFERLADDIMFGTVNPKHKDFKYVNGQIRHFLKEGLNVVLAKNGQTTTYCLDGVQPENILSRVYKMAEKTNGSS